MIAALCFFLQTGPDWFEDIEKAVTQAKEKQKLICLFIDSGCDSSRATQRAFSDKSMIPFHGKLVFLRLPSDNPIARSMNVLAPAVVVLNSDLPDDWDADDESEEDSKIKNAMAVGTFNIDCDFTLRDFVDVIGVRFLARLHRSILVPDAIGLSIKCQDKLLSDLLHDVLAPLGMDYRIRHGSLEIAPKSRIARMKIGQLTDRDTFGFHVRNRVVLRSTPEEVPDRVAQVHEALSTKRVTLDPKCRPLKEILAKLQEETGLNILVDGDSQIDTSVKTNLAAEGRLLGTVVRDLANRFQLGYSILSPHGIIMLYRPPPFTADVIARFLGDRVEFADSELSSDELRSITTALSVLGDDDPRVREAAHARLDLLKPRARRLMRKCLETTCDPEVRWRLEVLLQTGSNR